MTLNKRGLATATLSLLSSALLAASFSTTAVAADDQVRWKVQAVFNTNWPGLGNPIRLVEESLNEASDGQAQIKVFEPGKIVPPFGITEAVKNKQIPAGYAWLAYDQGKMPAAALFAAVPFGMDPLGYSAWWYEGGGHQLAEKLYAEHNIHPILCSITGAETAGWFRKEINTPEDLKGLKIRFAGLGGKVLQKLGASVTVIPGGEIFPALEKGAIDATEFATPAIDEMLGFDKVAKHNYFPGWHQPFTASHLVVNTDVWNALSKSKQSLIETACTAATFRGLAYSESLQGAELETFDSKGVTPHRLSPELMSALESATNEVMQETSASDPMFKEVYESMKGFQQTYSKWHK
ncbi:MAG: TRAP transporter substrate-binding protein, partial [Oceanospirillales bacterium]|nr:TRAP transporter substrate-binding protein [Oceanospirillales bacterium]